MNIGSKIKEIRTNLGLSQEEFACLINKSTSAIKKYEANNNITVDLLQSISEKLDISIISLFTDSNDLFQLFIDIYSFDELPTDEKHKLKIEFNAFIEFLVNKYNSK